MKPRKPFNLFRLLFFLFTITAGIFFLSSCDHASGSSSGDSSVSLSEDFLESEKNKTEDNYEGFLFYAPSPHEEEKEKGIPLKVGLSLEDTLSLLPEPLSTFEAESCALPGMDIIYTFSGYELTVYQGENSSEKSSPILSAIRLTDDSQTTAEGIYIGSTTSELVAVYGDCTPVSGEYCYQKGEMELAFLTRNNVIISIEYRIS